MLHFEIEFGTYNQAVQALKPFLRDFRFGNILYREYRSGSIHDFTFNVDMEFFDQTAIYPSYRKYPGDSTKYLELIFPSRWILDLYKSSVDNYELALLNKKKLPIGLWALICNITEMEYLDDSTVQDGRDLNFRVDK